MSLRNTLFYIWILLVFASCKKEFGCLNGTGNIEMRTIDLSEIKSIAIEIDAQLELTQGEQQSIVIEGEGNLIDEILNDSKVDGDQWKIDIRGCSVTSHVIFHMTLATIEKVDIQANAQMKTIGAFSNIPDLQLKIDGTGVYDMELIACEKLALKIDGSGSYDLKGSGSELDINIGGEANIRSKNYITQTTEIQIDGEGNCEVHPEQTLDIDIDGSGSICFLGDPAISFNNDGEGSFEPCD